MSSGIAINRHARRGAKYLLLMSIVPLTVLLFQVIVFDVKKFQGYNKYIASGLP